MAPTIQLKTHDMENIDPLVLTDTDNQAEDIADSSSTYMEIDAL
jgi:hypothetical protein